MLDFPTVKHRKLDFAHGHQIEDRKAEKCGEERRVMINALPSTCCNKHTYTRGMPPN